MGKLLSKSEMIEKIAAEHSELSKKQVKGVIASLATVGYKELKKESGMFCASSAKSLAGFALTRGNPDRRDNRCHHYGSRVGRSLAKEVGGQHVSFLRCGGIGLSLPAVRKDSFQALRSGPLV